jgi:long-chain acyl-CoA synthetase
MKLTDFDAANTLVGLFLDRAEELGDRPFLTAKTGGQWKPISYRDAADQVVNLARKLRELGLKDGDRVVLVSENRPEWVIADLAIMAAGCITVPTYVTNTERDHTHILDNSGARAVIVSTAKLAKVLLPAVIQTGLAEHVIAIEPLESSQSGSFALHTWSAMVGGEPDSARAIVRERMAALTRDDIACIIYTSGTGGAPRGVLLHHGAILRNVDGAARVLAGDFGWDQERFLSFLPMSHALEHTAGIYLPIALGAEICFAEGLDKLASNIEETRPSFMIVVPRLFEVLRGRVMKQVEKQGRFASYLLDRAIAIGEAEANGRSSILDLPMKLLLARTLKPKIRAKFGGRMKAMVSGGAPLNPDVGIFFQSLGLTMLQGYGQTETAPVVSCNYPSAGIRMATVGPPLKGVEVKIAADGEILVRGEQVMKGYWRNDEETARTIVADPADPDGGPWLHTGDIGHFDEGGRIMITDRKKDIIVSDKGDNIAPQKLEGMLTLQREISQAMVYGDRKPNIVALIVPDTDWSLEWARAQGEKFDLGDLTQLPAYRSAIRAAVDRVNQDLSVIEKIRQFAFADEGFTIDNGEMTPSMKIRRHIIRERYRERLDALYR